VQRNANLDLLRTVAVTMVIVGHLPEMPASYSPVARGIGDWFRAYGGLGVDLFFVLSGFLVSGLLFREYVSRARVNVGRFLIRRGFKIYPSFYVFVAVTVSLRIVLGDVLTPRQVLSELLFVQNYGPHLWSHTWSLAVEEHFYLLLAALVFIICRPQGGSGLGVIPRVFWATTGLVLVARALTLWLVPYSTPTHRFPTHLEIDSLFTGVVISYYFHTDDRLAPLARRRIGLLACIGVAALTLAQYLPTAAERYLLGHILTNIGFGAVVLAAVVLPSPRDWFSRTMTWIGSQSYSIYLWHAAVMAFGSVLIPRFAGRPLSVYQTAAWYVPGSFAIGVIMAKLVELPALQLRERLFSDDVRALHPAKATTAATAPVGSAAV